VRSAYTLASSALPGSWRSRVYFDTQLALYRLSAQYRPLPAVTTYKPVSALSVPGRFSTEAGIMNLPRVKSSTPADAKETNS